MICNIAYLQHHILYLLSCFVFLSRISYTITIIIQSHVFSANVAYGKHVTKTPANKKIAIFTDGHIHDREEFYNTQSISIDLKRTYSIKKVIFHTYNSARK